MNGKQLTIFIIHLLGLVASIYWGNWLALIGFGSALFWFWIVISL